MMFDIVCHGIRHDVKSPSIWEICLLTFQTPFSNSKINSKTTSCSKAPGPGTARVKWVGENRSWILSSQQRSFHPRVRDQFSSLFWENRIDFIPQLFCMRINLFSKFSYVFLDIQPTTHHPPNQTFTFCSDPRMLAPICCEPWFLLAEPIWPKCVFFSIAA